MSKFNFEEDLEEELYEFNAIMTYERYYNEDTSYGVYKFITKDDIPETEESYSDSIMETYGEGYKYYGDLVGRMQHLTVGGEYRIKAYLNYDRKYGAQYLSKVVCAIAPQKNDKARQALFLNCLPIRSNTIDNLLNAYPNIVNDVIEGNIDTIDYDKVSGVREYTWNKIKKEIIDNYLISDIIEMLVPIGVTYNMVRRLLEDEPNPSLLKQKIEDNPYTLTKVRGLGFKRVDNFALKLKPEMVDSKERLVAFVTYFLRKMGEEDGHTWCTTTRLKNEISNNVTETMAHFDWLLGNKDFLHIEDDKVGLKSFYDVEIAILNDFKYRIKNKDKCQLTQEITDEEIEDAIKKSEEEQGFEYTNEQKDVIYRTIRSNVTFITGKAGGGKTSIVRAIMKIYYMHGNCVSASAMSAMAAKRITEATGYPASTIHRTLGAKGTSKFTYDSNNKLPFKVVFLDEGSMVSATLFLSWLSAIKGDAVIIIAGDAKQLPPIGYGNIFSDLLDFYKDICVCELTKPMRQAQKSGILTDANKIREKINPVDITDGKIIHGELKDMFYSFDERKEKLCSRALSTYFNSIKKKSATVDNMVIIVPRKQGCLNCTLELNNKIQDYLFDDSVETIDTSNMSFKLGAKVLQTVNDYENGIYNGDIGYVTKIFWNTDGKNGKKKEKNCVVKFDNKEVVYNKSKLNELNLAYALTTHKCQGSGYKFVICIIDMSHYTLLDNCMLYTMLTRAKQRCLLLAQPQAFAKSLTESNNQRNTWLSLINSKKNN